MARVRLSAPAGMLLAIALVRVGGDVIPPSYGEMTITLPNDVKVVSPLGKEGEFELELEGASPGSYPAHVVHAGGECDFSLAIPEGRGLFVVAGDVECVQP